MRVDGILKRLEGENFSGCDDKLDNNFLNNDDYSQFTEKWLNECKMVLKDNEIRKK